MSSVTAPTVQQKYPRPHKWLPQYFFLRAGNSRNRRSRTLSLEILCDLGWGQVAWSSDRHMHMVRPHMPSLYGQLILAADLAQQIPHAQPNFPTPYRVAVLGFPHKVVLQLQYRVRSTAIAVFSKHPKIIAEG